MELLSIVKMTKESEKETASFSHAIINSSHELEIQEDVGLGQRKS